MDLGIIYSGKFGERFVCNLADPKLCPRFGACGIEICDLCKKYDFSSKISFVQSLPEPNAIGLYVEEPEGYVQKFSCDVLVAINVHPDILISLPKIGEFKALIVPACDQKWCSPGLRRQLSEKCEQIGIEFVSPKPFCSLIPRGNILRRFCDEFSLGRPEFFVELDDNAIISAEVLRSDPCGSAYYVAKKMKGFVIEDLSEFYKEIHQHQCAYPCMASMERDVELIEAPFHLAGYIMVYNFSKAVGIEAKDFVPEHFRKIVLI
ncbi:MAG: hypothetical protein NZ872_00170 [Archaeoglobaceae archaeon]|nr:hypothetical protein [Archaeoglobaceae archaeon]MDW8127615.1 DUF166 family protein [Archaeoglobaceae archaeon]